MSIPSCLPDFAVIRDSCFKTPRKSWRISFPYFLGPLKCWIQTDVLFGTLFAIYQSKGSVAGLKVHTANFSAQAGNEVLEQSYLVSGVASGSESGRGGQS
jgi:hypothetical protein